MENIHDDQSQKFEHYNLVRMESDQNENSAVKRAQKTVCSKSKPSPTACEFASSALQESAIESSKARLSGAASVFIPGGVLLSLTNDSVSSNGTLNHTRHGFDDDQGAVADDSAANISFRNHGRVQHEQTPEHHGVHLQGTGRSISSQHGSLPLLVPPPLSESPLPNSACWSTIHTEADNTALPSSADKDWFLKARPLEQAIGGTNRNADDILNALGVPDGLSVPNASYQTQEYHKQPHAPCLTRILQLAIQDQKNRDDRFAALEKREVYFRSQISFLTATIADLRKRKEQNAEVSAGLDDLKLKLSATQDQIQQLVNEHEKLDLGKALAQVEELKTEKEQVQRRCDWYRNWARTLQFVEITDLMEKIQQLEDQIKDLRFYPERLTAIYQGRINGLESALQTVAEGRDELQKRLVNALSQRDRALEELRGGVKGHGILPACVYDYREMEKLLKKQIENLKINVADLQRHKLEVSKLMAENKALKSEKRVLESDRVNFWGQINQIQKDRTGAKKAIRELETTKANLKRLEEEKVVWEAKEVDYIKQRDDEAVKSAAEKDELQQQVKELLKQLEQKAWEAEKAKNEAQKFETQRVNDALSQENSRGREFCRNFQAPITPPMSDSVRSSSEETGASRTSCGVPSPPSAVEYRLEPTGREDYM